MATSTISTMRARPSEGNDGPNPYLNGRGSNRRKSFQGFMRAVADTVRPESRASARDALKNVYGSEYLAPNSPGQISKALLREESGLTGGYLVPTEYSTALLTVLSEESFILPRATKVAMASRESSCPVFQTRTASGTPDAPSYFGNMAFKWGSTQAPLETEPLFDEVSLTAWDLLGYTTVANQFLEDAGEEAEAALITMFGRAASWFLENAFLRGRGTGSQMPTGIVGCPGQMLVARQTTNTVTINDITAMTSALLPQSWQHAIWACHPSALLPIQRLTAYFINIELGGMHKMQPRPAGALSTLPLYVTDKLPTMGANVTGDLILFDPTLYVWGSRQDVVVDVSTHPGFRTAQTDFRVWLRADGKPMVSKPITLPDQTTQVSPFVVLLGK